MTRFDPARKLTPVATGKDDSWVARYPDGSMGTFRSSKAVQNLFLGGQHGYTDMSLRTLAKLSSKSGQTPDPDCILTLAKLGLSGPRALMAGNQAPYLAIELAQELAQPWWIATPGENTIAISDLAQGLIVKARFDALADGAFDSRQRAACIKDTVPQASFAVAEHCRAVAMKNCGFDPKMAQGGAGYGITGQSEAEGRLFKANQAIINAATQAAYNEGIDTELLACRLGQLCRTLYGQELRQGTLENWATRKLEQLKQPDLFDTKTMEIGSAD